MSQISDNSSAPPAKKSCFRLAGKAFHLTIKNHQDVDSWMNQIKERFGDFTWWSWVHEESHGETPYEHTHLAFELKKKAEVRDAARTFDFNGEHCNIQPFKSMQHKMKVWEDYHTKEGCIRREKSEFGPAGRQDLAQLIKAAPDLAAAIAIAGVEIKSVSDVKLIRDDVARPPPFEHSFPTASWDPSLPQSDDPDGQNYWPRPLALILWGVTGTGKTQWAAHQFTNPLIVSTRDQLKKFNSEEHDGIVFDDMDFSKWDRTELIHLLDWDLARQISCRYHDAVIPKHTVKIFTSNKPFSVQFAGSCGFCGTDGALLRRIHRHEVTRQTWLDQLPIQEVQANDDEADMHAMMMALAATSAPNSQEEAQEELNNIWNV